MRRATGGIKCNKGPCSDSHWERCSHIYQCVKPQRPLEHPDTHAVKHLHHSTSIISFVLQNTDVGSHLRQGAHGDTSLVDACL